MIKVIHIDDERPALRGMAHMLKDYSCVDILGQYIDPYEGLEKVKEIKPDAVFLDINIPQLKGTDIASQILEESPDTVIIFVTAYEEYAIQAFELRATDYLLKPVAKERLKRTIDYLIEIKMKREDTPLHEQLHIDTLGKLSIYFQGKEPIKWRTEKTKELFAFLLHHHGKEVSKDYIVDRLWNGVEVKRAYNQLYNGIYYIRKTLHDYGVKPISIQIKGRYCLTLKEVEVNHMSLIEGYSQVSEVTGLQDIEALQ